jgi:hypothetical protein
MFTSFFQFLRTGLQNQVRAIVRNAIRNGVQQGLQDAQDDIMGDPLEPSELIEPVSWTDRGSNKAALRRKAWLHGESHAGTVAEIQARLTETE